MGDHREDDDRFETATIEIAKHFVRCFFVRWGIFHDIIIEVKSDVLEKWLLI